MIYSDEFIRIERENSQIPWVKIFTIAEYKELSDCDEKTLNRLFCASLECERVMREFYNPTKINMASFANYVPRVHIHIQARFSEDEYFPESMWGKKQRESSLNLGDFEEFAKILKARLEAKFS